jgi:hypothetical protein
MVRVSPKDKRKSLSREVGTWEAIALKSAFQKDSAKESFGFGNSLST